jgi:hypothetical protein
MKQRAKSQSTPSTSSVSKSGKVSATELNESHLPPENAAKTIISIASILLYAFCFAVIYLVYYTDVLLPPTNQTLPHNSPQFSVPNARAHLNRLVSFGPRLVGGSSPHYPYSL